MLMTTADIKKALMLFKPPILNFLQQDWLAEREIKQVQLVDNQLMLEIELGYPITDIEDALSEVIKAELSRLTQISAIELILRAKIVAHAVKPNLKAVPGVKNIIAIASGKGEVGKSTTTTNLAAALSAQGA